MADGERGIGNPPDFSAHDRKTPSHSLSGPEVAHAEGKTYFQVPFERKEAARAAGLRWDLAVRKWYAPNNEIAKSFLESSCGEVVEPAVHERAYFNVPFLQKERAKALGMLFDGIRKLWFAPNAAVAVAVVGMFTEIAGLSDEERPESRM